MSNNHVRRVTRALRQVLASNIAWYFVGGRNKIIAIASFLHVNHTTICRWNTGDAAPKIENIVGLGLALDVPVPCFFCNGRDVFCTCPPALRPPHCPLRRNAHVKTFRVI